MKELTLKDFVKIREVGTNICKVSYLQWQTSPPPNSNMGGLTVVPMTKTIQLTDDIIDEKKLIHKSIQILLDKQTQHIEKFNVDVYKFDIYPVDHKKGVDFLDSDEKTKKEKRILISRLMMLSNMIAQDSREGPGNIIIFPEKLKNMPVSLSIGAESFWTSELKHDIIILRKPNNDSETTFTYFHNDDKYTLEFIGDYELSYNVLHTKTLVQERTEKIERLLDV